MRDDAAARQLEEAEVLWISQARDMAHLLYEGRETPHRSCGIALAETFNLRSRPYQSLRRGGITGEGRCGAIRAGEMVLGEILGDPDPIGSVTDALRAAMVWYQSQVPERIERGRSPDYICSNLTEQHGPFGGPDRASHCTRIAFQVAELAAEALVRFGPGITLSIKLTIEDER